MQMQCGALLPGQDSALSLLQLLHTAGDCMVYLGRATSKRRCGVYAKARPTLAAFACTRATRYLQQRDILPLSAPVPLPCPA